jgi:hypothetical protein
LIMPDRVGAGDPEQASFQLIRRGVKRVPAGMRPAAIAFSST